LVRAFHSGLPELRKILEGQAFDKEAAERAKGIMEAIRIHDAKLATHGAPVTH
jgi:hypothetical protein